MTAALIAAARAAGVTLLMEPPDRLTLRGDPAAVAEWAPRLRSHKPAVLAELTPRALWWITELSGECWKSCFAPPVARAQVLGWYPDAEVEPIEGTGKTAARVTVTCATCRHFVRDLVGDGTGLGQCVTNAPASRRPPALWPNAPRCTEHTAQEDRP